MTEEYLVGYEEGYQAGYNEAIDDITTAVLAEREACANVCDIFAENETGFVAEDCAAAIRARGEK